MPLSSMREIMLMRFMLCSILAASGSYSLQCLPSTQIYSTTSNFIFGFCRCLDKAAIILPDKTLEQQEGNRWRLCRVTEIEETKGLLRMIPICLTFIIPGVVSSIGFTYFLEQADHLNRKSWKIKRPSSNTLIVL